MKLSPDKIIYFIVFAVVCFLLVTFLGSTGNLGFIFSGGR